MHMANLDLQAKALTDADLDPNATHGRRIEILKQLLEISGSYDQTVGYQNQRIIERDRFNDSRHRELTARRSSLQNERLALGREIAQLEAERARMELDKTATDKTKAVKQTEIDKKKEELAAVKAQIDSDDGELKTLNAQPSGSPTAAALPTPTSSPRLPEGILDKLTKEDWMKLLSGSDPKLNATTMLDNTVQLQYEIIAKQLTLLRDELGPGERLVFLELPQSIYTTPGVADEKMAQTWWHVNGYTRTDPLVRLLLELYEVEWKWKKIQEVEAFKRVATALTPLPCMEDGRQGIEAALVAAEAAAEKKAVEEKKPAPPKADVRFGKMYHDFKCERADARERILQNLFREASSDFDRVEQNGARDTSQIIDAVRKMIEVKAVGRRVTQDDDAGPEEIAHSFVDLAGTGKDAETRRKDILNTRNDLLNILSNPTPDVKPHPERPDEPLYSFYQGIEFVRLDEGFGRARQEAGSIERRTVRAVDIIPRQSSLNVNDIQHTVKATGILAAFKFLFGFAGQVNYHRQREQFEQFIHQELYASGFGKGNRDFGWTFGALPGTKRVAPGVRTTYAALVVPDDAESIVLSARGCYFPRKNYQPLHFEDTGHDDWDREGKYRRYNCGDEQTYILPVPGGGDTSNFWVTNIDYQGQRKPGEFITVSVRGNNFSSQMGVLVDGVPLFPTVGLGHPHLIPRRAATGGAAAQPAVGDCANVTDAICGRYERIDPRQIVFTFRMKDSFKGKPTITLIGPGKSVDLNMLRNLTIRDGKARHVNASLSDGNVAAMFGPPASLSITDLQVLSVGPNSTKMLAVVTGTGFTKTDSVFVNGEEVTGNNKLLRGSQLYRLTFDLPAGQDVNVTIAQDGATFTKSITNPAALKITGATVIGYDPPVAKKSRGLLTVKIVGTGFSPRLGLATADGASLKDSRVMYVSPAEAIVRLAAPDSVVVFTVIDTGTKVTDQAVVQRPAVKKEEGKD